MRIPTPDRGQPLDVTYIYKMAQVINELAAEVAPSTYNYSSVNTPEASIQNVKTSDLRIVASYVPIVAGATVSPDKPVPFTFPYSSFKYTPVVTATPVNVENSPLGNNVSVVITNTTKDSVSGNVYFGASGVLTLNLNIVAIGVAA
jgi:hypothetical protein